MKVVIKTKNLRLTKALKDFIEEKINSLEKFLKIFGEEYYDHFFGRGKPRVEAWIEVGKETLHHKKGPFFWAECQMRLPGRSLRSVARSNDLKLAITEVKDELQRELKEYKEKIIDKTKRRQRALKKLSKISSRGRLQPTHRPPASRAPFWRKGRIREEGI